MTAVAGGDAWRITGEDRAKHDSQFFTLKPVNGYISGDQARGFFMQSGLPTPILGQIWSLADMNNDGKMDKKEFSIAMHLIKKKLQGYELPKSLPHTLKADPSPMIGSFGTVPQPAGMVPMGPQMGMPSMGMVAPIPMSVGARVPMMSNGVPPMVPTAGFMGAPVSAAPGGFQGAVPGKQGAGPAPAAGTPTFALPHTSKLKYTQMFNTNDRNKKGTLTGVEARAILVQTGVPQQLLAQIWNLSDYDKDGKLSCDEFCIAMHLIDLVRMGAVLPAKLPAELVPGKVGRSGSFGTMVTPPPTAVPVPQKDNFGDLLGNMGMPPPVQPTPATNGETAEAIDDKSPFTFEDKRKQNFDKGQAELERRRQMLQEQMRREEAARQEKERKEQELRERQRQEQEMKKQQELERQMEKQRQIEKQKEEQRQKMMEQRESARRELERQRQMEWERQRKEQLMAEKGREYEQLMALKSQTSNFTCELESLQGKKTEISTKISQVKNGVTDFTAHIEAMRSTRDLKLADIERIQKDLQELSQKLQSVQSQKQELDLKVQTSVQNNPMSETHRTMMHSVELKRTSVQRLKKDLEEMEKQTETRLTEIDQANAEIKESEGKIQSLQSDISKTEQQQKLDNKQQTEEADRVKKEKEKHEKLRKELEAQRIREEEDKKKKAASKASTDTSLGGNWFDFGGDTKTSTTNDNWASVFDSQPKPTQQSTGVWDSLSSQASTATTITATDHDQKKIKLSGPTQKYKALYQFEARNADELSLEPGDIVMVFNDQTGAEPGWKGGEMNGKSGWFPEAYVEKVPESSQTVFGIDLSSSTNAISTSEESSFMAVPGKMPSVSPTPGQGKTAPEGLQAQALYPWKAKKENHLTFNKGDVILVREQQDMWWSGDLNGKVGWFPKSYVKLISGPAASSASNSLTNSPSLTPTSSLDIARDSPSLEKKDTEMYVAVYAYQSDVDGDLTFSVGEIIHVSKTEGDWWTGSIGDKTGIFPANYVKKSETQLQQDYLPPEPTTEAPPTHFPSDQQSPLPHDPLKSTPSENNPGSALSLDPIAELGSDLKSLTLTADLNIGSATTGSSDPFANLGSFTTVSKSSEAVSPSVTVSQTAPNSLDPLSNLVSLGGSNAFAADPFPDLSSATFPAPTNEMKTEASLSKLDIGEKAANPDPYAAFSGLSEENPFPSDPFAGSDEFGNDGTSGNNGVTSSGDMFGNTSNTAVELNDNKTDPYAAFAELGGLNEASAPGAHFPAPPTDMFASVEKDALQSDLPVLTNIAENSQPSSSSVDFSIQTTASDPFSSFNTVLSGQTSATAATTSELFSTVSSPSDSTPPPLPTKQGPQRPAPPPSLKRSVSKTEDSPDGDSYDPSSPMAPVHLASFHDPSQNKINFSYDGSNTALMKALKEDSFLSYTADIEAPDTSVKVKSFSFTEFSDQEKALVFADTILASPKRRAVSMSLSKKHRPPPAPPKTSKPPRPSTLPGLSKPPRPSRPPSSKGSSHMSKKQMNGNTPSVAPPKQQQGGTLKKPEIATVIAEYTATGPEQLSLNPGQLIQVRKKSSSGWWEGELQARGQKRKIGWFPANYVKLLQGSARATPDNTLGGGTRGMSPALGTPPVPPGISPAPGSLQDNKSANPSPAPIPVTQPAAAPQTTQTPHPKYVDHVIALYPYTAQHGDELTFLKDAVINIIKKEGTEWWQGECNGQIGMFPANYVTSTTPDSTSWSTDPAVLAVTSSEEGKRQTYIHELINTEETYMEDMSVVMDAFYKPFQSSGALTEEQLQAIFVNWQELIICNMKFLKALRVRKKMCGKGQVINMIGDMLCENIPHFKPYIRFCSCQLNAAALLQRLTENSSQFREIHKKCVTNPKTKGMPLSSFLLKPMQRITKYPLIVEKILKYTAESHPDHQQLLDALEHTQELCSQVNEGVREKENSDRLEWIQQHVQCDGLAEAKSNKELGAFLFNDFLLLTTSNRPLISTHSLFDVTGHVQYKMYKTPVFLNEVMVKKPTEEESDVFHLSHIDRVYNLRCHSQNDRDTWVRKLETASRHYLDTERKKRDKAMSYKVITPKNDRGMYGKSDSRRIDWRCRKTVRRSQGVGRLLVVIMEGIDLMASDANGKSDPYCEVSMGSQEHKTKVISNNLNPKWNASMQFSIQNVDTDTLCITVFDRDLFSPNDFLGRTEIQVKEILKEAGNHGRRPIIKHLLLHEVGTGEIVVKLDLHLFELT